MRRVERTKGRAMGTERCLEQAIARQQDRQKLRQQVLFRRYRGYRGHLSTKLAKTENLIAALGLGVCAGLCLGAKSKKGSAQQYVNEANTSMVCSRLLVDLLDRQLNRALQARRCACRGASKDGA